MDETDCFWRALPDKGFGMKRKQCKEGKKCKQRMTVALFVNAAGEKETPVVIWKSENPRCFKGIDKSKLAVSYFSQQKSWMTGEILYNVLTKLNRQLSAKQWSILLMMDNAGCHPPDLKDKYSNIKILFLPANTTSKLQPLNLGIIQNFKVYYCCFLLHYVLAKIDTCSTASEIVKSVNILTAIRWVVQAWEQVKEETIRKCFKKAGVLDDELNVFTRGTDSQNDNPFLDVDASTQLQELMVRALPSEDICSLDEYISGEGSLPVCLDMDDTIDIFTSLTQSSATGDGELESRTR